MSPGSKIALVESNYVTAMKIQDGKLYKTKWMNFVNVMKESQIEKEYLVYDFMCTDGKKQMTLKYSVRN